MTEPVTHTLARPGATLTYDVRGELDTGPDGDRVLLLIGSPMGAGGFPTLASHLSDRTVVTYDPRGVERSVRSDGEGELDPTIHAADLAALVEELGVGPVDVFASSGGAVNGLALVAARPELVATLVAHEPPLCAIVDDAANALAAVADMIETYRTRGMGPAMATFIAFTQHEGPVPDDYLDAPAPDPAMFGLPTDDDGSRGDALLGQNLRGTCTYVPDVEAIAAAPTRIVVGVGEESGGQLARRAGEALAGQLGLEPVVFPGGHAGFLGDEYGMPGRPVEFAARLREVLG